MSRRLTATLAARALGCRHSWFLECHGDATEKVADDAGTMLQRERGLAREVELVASLAGVERSGWNGTNWVEAREATLTAMRRGAPWIYQAVLEHGDMSGIPDLLQRVEVPSALGSYGYQPVDVKSHREVAVKDRMQLGVYAMLLEPILGHPPEKGAIWLNDGRMEWLELRPDTEAARTLADELRQIGAGQVATTALRCSECGRCPWRKRCRAEWEREQSASLLYNVSGGTAAKLHRAGFISIPDLVAVGVDEIAARLNLDREAASRLAARAQAWAQRRPIALMPPKFPSGLPIYYYDIETFGQVTYLHGVIRVEGDSREERQFVAERPDQEGVAWHQFLDWLARDQRAVVWCWTDYERGFADSLWAKYRGNQHGYDLLRANLTDQCAFVRDHFALPATSYSIKQVAPLFGFHWDASDAGGLNSEAWYGEWITKQDRALLKKILRYNLDDVVAMEVVDRALRALTLQRR